jgi:hypothetical protein
MNVLPVCIANYVAEKNLGSEISNPREDQDPT